jgi:NAD(P)H-dependent flavin oxidoreductase YrpB (nitropropane dioxygenase family)
VSISAKTRNHLLPVNPYVFSRLFLSKERFTDSKVNVIAAGGIYDGRGLAAMLMYGAQAVWVGTRFVAATEASAPKKHKEL